MQLWRTRSMLQRGVLGVRQALLSSQTVTYHSLQGLIIHPNQSKPLTLRPPLAWTVKMPTKLSNYLQGRAYDVMYLRNMIKWDQQRRGRFTLQGRPRGAWSQASAISIMYDGESTVHCPYKVWMETNRSYPSWCFITAYKDRTLSSPR